MQVCALKKLDELRITYISSNFIESKYFTKNVLNFSSLDDLKRDYALIVVIGVKRINIR